MKTPSFFIVALATLALAGHAITPTKPVLFVTQVPVPNEINDRTVAVSFLGVAGVFANAQADTLHCARGGGLWIYYPGTPNPTLVNLTATATWSIPGGNPGTVTRSRCAIRRCRGMGRKRCSAWSSARPRR